MGIKNRHLCFAIRYLATANMVVELDKSMIKQALSAVVRAKMFGGLQVSYQLLKCIFLFQKYPLANPI